MQHARNASDSSRQESLTNGNGAVNGHDTVPPPHEDGSDSDAVWLHTVVQGIRMLCRTGNAEDAREFIPVLDYVLQRCHLPKDQMQQAQNEARLAEGIWNFVVAMNC